jgi:pimeloyl-ACP methyl ester carboxylesterase
VLLLLGDGTQLAVTELPGDGPWTFLVLQADSPGPAQAGVAPGRGSDGADQAPPAGPAGPEPGEAARALTRFGRAVVPDLRGRPGWGEPPGGPGFLDLVDDLDRVRTRAGLGRPVLVGLGGPAPVARRAAADQPWAWRALVLTSPATQPHASPAARPLVQPAVGPAVTAPAVDAADLDRLDLPALEWLLGGLGGGPGWAGIAPDAPPR